MENIHLDLFNFELPENQTCQYVLTSPRSLQACRQLNVRPVDLLPKSEQQLSEERPNLAMGHIKESLKRFETKRIRTLKAARALRENIILRSSLKKRLSNLERRRQEGSREKSRHPQKPPPALNRGLQRMDNAKEEAMPSLASDGPPDNDEALRQFDIDKTAKERTNETIQRSLNVHAETEEAKEKYETEFSEKQMNMTGRDRRPTRGRILSTRRPSSGRKKKRAKKSVDSPEVFIFPKEESSAGQKKSLGRRGLSKGETSGGGRKASGSVTWQSSRPTKSVPALESPQLLMTSGSADKVQEKQSESENGKEFGKVLETSAPLPNTSTPVLRPSSKQESKKRKGTSTPMPRRPYGLRYSSDPECQQRAGGGPSAGPSWVISSPELNTQNQVERGRTMDRKASRYGKLVDQYGKRKVSSTGNGKFIKNANLSRSADNLERYESRGNSPSTSSLPASITPVPEHEKLVSRPLSATSDSSLSSLSSNFLDAYSDSTQRIKKRERGVRLASTFPRRRPASSLAVPTYLKDPSPTSEKFPFSKVRANSAKLPQTCPHFLSPGSLEGIYRTTSTVSLADSQILSRFLVGIDKNIEVTPHDRKILELLALKHEKRYNDEVNASKKNHRWAQEREQELKDAARRLHDWKLQIREKRNRDTETNQKRWMEIEDRYHQSQDNLITLLNGKERRSHELLQNQKNSRERRKEERKKMAWSKKEMVRAAIRAKEERLELKRRQLLAMWERQQHLVEQRKREREEVQKKRLTDTSGESRERHEEKQRHVEAEGRALLEAIKRAMEERLARSEANVRAMKITKSQSRKRHAHERERKANAVRVLHDQLEVDLLKWRQHVLERQLQMAEEAESRFSSFLQSKSSSTQEKLKMRQEHHRQLFEQVKEKERNHEAVAREILAVKDMRAENVARQKEWRSQKAKNSALLSASIRDDLRKRFCPETFDQMAARALVEARISESPSKMTLSRVSHIFLG